MPLIILEGPDGSGKSTLAARLLKGTGCPTLLVKRSGPPGQVETLAMQADWLTAQGRSPLNIIADRHPLISETIYAPVIRDVDPGWGQAQVFSYFEKIAARDRALIIYCRAPYERMLAGSKVEEQMEGVHARYKNLVTAYDGFMAQLARRDYDVYRYDFTEDPFAVEAIERVKNHWGVL
jgi:hypothetical protein